ncbi:hypothetical protein GT037_011176 [Alternaria burnsii]|uniref:Uncharacterized protein n=1 Tax=Alternaria burnsii TaxID=1187904 RepID=A0A8H7ASK7_9PLEO|nr:uncharacterized protein GT037_011176 [Alternaria burnsii]KAF7670725.1 hypothetical protein GT037_011176 [Alternaria burnsii]
MAGCNTRALFRRVDQLLNKDLAYDTLTSVEFKASGIENDPFIVDWMLRDPVNPLEFTSIREWGFTFISSISALSVPFASFAYSGGSRSIISGFDESQHGSILVAAVVAPNVQSLIIFHFLAGAFDSSHQSNVGGVIADMFEAGERGLALTIFAAAPFLGPVMGPIVRKMSAVIYSIFENPGYDSILEQSASQHAEPEARLPPSIIGPIAIPIGLFWIV